MSEQEPRATTPPTVPGWGGLEEQSVERVRGWLVRAQSTEHTPGKRLHELLNSSEGVDFTREFLDLVARPEDAFTAAVNLRHVAQRTPHALPGLVRFAVRGGGIASLGFPWMSVPLAQRALDSLVGHLVLTAPLPKPDRRPSATDQDTALAPGVPARIRPDALAQTLSASTPRGTTATLTLLDGPVLGPAAAQQREERLLRLIAHPQVTRLVVSLADLVPGLRAWATEDDLTRSVTALRPLALAAVEYGVRITLAEGTYAESRLIPAAVMRLLDEPELRIANLGFTLQAALPEAPQLLSRFTRWARDRAALGGAPVHVRFTAGQLREEVVRSILTGLPVPQFETAQDTRVALKRLLDTAFHPANVAAVRPVLATHNLFDIAGALALGERRGVADFLGVELRRGVLPAYEPELAEATNDLSVLTPLVRPRGIAHAVDYLLARIEDGADPESFLSAARTLASDAELFERERERFVSSCAAADTPGVPGATHRVQDRAREWDPSERDSALFYRPPAEDSPFDTGGLTAAVLGLTRGSDHEITLQPAGVPRRLPAVSESGFANEPDTDATRSENRAWARALLLRAGQPDAGSATAPEGALVPEAVAVPEGSQELPATEHSSVLAGGMHSDGLDELLTGTSLAAASWAQLDGLERGTQLRRSALGIVAGRDRLIEVLAAVTGRPIEEIDAEVSGAVDAARYAGHLAEQLDTIRGATFVPGGLTLLRVNEPTSLARLTEAMLSVLAAGGACVLLAPPGQARVVSVLLEELGAANLPTELVRLVVLPEPPGESAPGVERAEEPAAGSDDNRDHSDAPEVSDQDAPTDDQQDEGAPVEEPWEEPASDALAAEIARHPLVERAIVLGSREEARQLVRARPDLPVQGIFAAVGSIVVTPNADLADAVRSVVASAFFQAGQAQDSAQLVILVGSVARSKRFQRMLADAVRGLRPGHSARETPDQASGLDSTLAPLASPAYDHSRRSLTLLEHGERWLVQPEQADQEGRVWSPGIRLGVKPGSWFATHPAQAPVLGVMHALTLREALTIQSGPGTGGVAGLHSLDSEEIAVWVDQAQAASLFVNRPTVGARVERQPWGGWGSAGMGGQPLSGGPNRLVPLGGWALRPGTQSSTLHLRGLDPEVTLLIEAAQSMLEFEAFDLLRRAALSDQLAWSTEYSLVRDRAGLGIERNLLRYWPVPVLIRLAEGGGMAGLLRVLAAALLTRAPIAVSTGQVLPEAVTELLSRQFIEVSLERDSAWLERIAAEGVPQERVRLIGGDRVRTAEWLGGLDRVGLWAEQVTMAGPVELLSLLREQSLSLTAHRRGSASPLTDTLF